MKIWSGFGSEHSMNLVMIGRFQNVENAKDAKRLIDRLVKVMYEEQASGRLSVGEPNERYSEQVRAVVSEENCYIDTRELEQFVFDVGVELKGSTIELKTDESDISAFLKVLLEKEAKVEVFSAHHYPAVNEN